ncbi:MAG: hypothetical protein ABJA71_08105 [Ginsengibacter sp.]
MGGSFRLPVPITQKFWDEVTERRKQTKEQNENSEWAIVDTSYGSDDIGERPKMPDWLINIFEFIFVSSGILGWAIILGFMVSKFIK